MSLFKLLDQATNLQLDMLILKEIQLHLALPVFLIQLETVLQLPVHPISVPTVLSEQLSSIQPMTTLFSLVLTPLSPTAPSYKTALLLAPFVTVPVQLTPEVSLWQIALRLTLSNLPSLRGILSVLVVLLLLEMILSHLPRVIASPCQVLTKQLLDANNLVERLLMVLMVVTMVKLVQLALLGGCSLVDVLGLKQNDIQPNRFILCAYVKQSSI
eukprot:TRINITY_DN35288_c0_g1_i5.p1 TRINITY_DN35288_c0_g1~~TRINITY_DN35288_c0_g1_i5.p1  ORF type:complete len:214 (+),score=-11.16 TRINITY_DN35288_c0_g1_i5:291-932(+)